MMTPDLFPVPMTFRRDHRTAGEVFRLPPVHRCDSMFCVRCGKRNRFEHWFHRLMVCGRELYEFSPSYRRAVERAGGWVPEPCDIASLVEEIREIGV
jgi:hypothetical protein